MKLLRNVLRRKLGKLALVVSLSVIVIVPAYIIFSRFANSETTETIHITDPHPIAVKAATYQSLQTAYFTSQVPASWHINQRPNAISTRVQVLAYAPSGSDAQVAITSDVLPSDGLSGVGDYHLRTTNPQTYPVFTNSSLPSTVKAFTSTNDPSLLTIFMVHGSRYASVSVSGETDQQLSLQVLKTVMPEWAWL